MKKDREHVPVRDSGAVYTLWANSYIKKGCMKLNVAYFAHRSVVVLSASLRVILSSEGSVLLGSKLPSAD